MLIPGREDRAYYTLGIWSRTFAEVENFSNLNKLFRRFCNKCMAHLNIITQGQVFEQKFLFEFKCTDYAQT